MKKTIILILLFIPVTLFSQNDTIYKGTWDTQSGKVYLSQKGDIVTGSYDNDNGKIEGIVSESNDSQIYTCHGTWAKSNDNGEFIFTINGNVSLNHFDGKYNFSGEPSKWNEDWDGDRVFEDKILWDFTGTWKTEFGLLNLILEGRKVTGTYGYSDGKIKGEVYQEGDATICTGTWTERNDIGQFKFTLIKNHFDGVYNYTGKSSDPNKWYDDWDGDRQ